MPGNLSLDAFLGPSQGYWASEALCLTLILRCTVSTSILTGVTCTHHIIMSVFRQSCCYYSHFAEAHPNQQTTPDNFSPILPSIEPRKRLAGDRLRSHLVTAVG